MTVDTVVDTFGSRLRSLRQRAGLSQSEVGGERYSASYVSHLESGRRQATDEIVTHLAVRLGVGLEDLLGSDQHAYSAGSPDLAMLVADSALREAQRTGDPDLVRQRAEDAAREAARVHRADVWWHAQRCRMHALMSLSRYRDAAAIGDDLVRHPITLGSAHLQCDVLAQLARSYRSLGQLEQAHALTTQGLTLLAEQPVDAEIEAEVLIVHVAAVMDIGEFDDVVSPVARLTALRDQVQSGQARGQIAWVLGNVAFLTGDHERGLAEHDVAMGLFRPEVDLSLWARFRQASARLRLDAGLTDGVESLVDAAAMALSLVGNSGDLANLEMVRAAQALALGNPGHSLLLCDGVLHEPTPLSPQSRADVHVLRHRALLELDDVSGARDALRSAAELYEVAGAWQRAVGAWRARAELEGRV